MKNKHVWYSIFVVWANENFQCFEVRSEMMFVLVLFVYICNQCPVSLPLFYSIKIYIYKEKANLVFFNIDWDVIIISNRQYKIT